MTLRPIPRNTRAIGMLANGVIVALAVYLGVHAYGLWKITHRQQNQGMESLALALSQGLDAYFSSRQEGLLSLADAVQRTPGGINNLPEIQRLLVDHKRLRPELLLVFVSDLKGQMLAASNIATLNKLPNIGDQPSFKSFLREFKGQSTVYIGQTQLGRTTGDWAFSMRLVVNPSQGTPPFVLNLVIPVDYLSSLLREFTLDDSLESGLLRDDGYLLGKHPLPARNSLNDLLGQPRSGELMTFFRDNSYPEKGSVQGTSFDMPARQSLHTFHRLPHFPLTVYVAQPTRQITHRWLSQMILPTLAALLLAALVWLAVRRLVSREHEDEEQRVAIELRLRQREAEQNELFDHLMTGLVVHDGTGTVLRANAEACRALGLTLEQMTGKALIDPAWRFVADDGEPMPVENYPVARVLGTRLAVNNWVVGICKPGESDVTWVICNAYPLFDAQNQIRQIIVSFLDITQLRQLTIEMRGREAGFQSLFENSMDAVLMTSPDGLVLAANKAACGLFRLSQEEICTAGRTGLVDLSDPRLKKLLDERAASGKAMGVLTMIRGDGSRFEAELSSSVYLDGQGRAYTSMVIRDITERLGMQAALESVNENLRRANEQLVEMAHYDVLTHLPNRVLLTDRLQQAIAHATRRRRSVAVALLDLDGFKAVNDRYGHAAGDELLIQLAKRFRTALRDGDTLARLGGDEFVMVMTDLGGAHDCIPPVQRLLSLAAEPVITTDWTVTVSASVGVTIFPIDASDPEQLMRHADQAMYLAKQGGKNRYHLFDVASDMALRERRDNLKAIQLGCERHEFVLFYQPQVNMRTGEVVGLEALIRWHHPERGLLPPGLFLPQIEEHDFAVDMGEMIIDLALQQINAWRSDGIAISVSINLFARQLQEPDFFDRLVALLKRYPDIPPRQIELEIVETNALDDLGKISALMRTCTSLGLRFALDDFGTGYSSLSYLKKLPAELLKIDQTFVRDMLEDKDDFAIVRGVIELARAFGRKVIAEGVETEAHGRQLLAIGCELGQGYGIARPMPADAVPEWLAQWKTQRPWLPGVEQRKAATLHKPHGDASIA